MMNKNIDITDDTAIKYICNLFKIKKSAITNIYLMKKFKLST